MEKKKRMARIGRLLLGIGLAAVIVLLAVPWSMADAAGLSGSVTVEGVTLLRCTVSDEPEMVTVQDREGCRQIVDQLWMCKGRWNGFAGKTFIQDHGVSYEIYISRPDEQPVHYRLFDGKLYCGSFRYALTSSDAAALTQCITELMEK